MPNQRVAGVNVAAPDRREALTIDQRPPPARGARARRAAQPVSAARPLVGSSEGRPEAPPRPDARLCGGYMMGSGMGGGCMLGSGN